MHLEYTVDYFLINSYANKVCESSSNIRLVKPFNCKYIFKKTITLDCYKYLFLESYKTMCNSRHRLSSHS